MMIILGLILGLASGLSSEVGRKGFIFGFLIADIVIVYTFKDNPVIILKLQEIFSTP